jgi:hypothetical protein
VPRYFFHLLETGETPLFDEDGEDLADFEAAKDEGVESLRDLVADRIKGGRPVLGWPLKSGTPPEPCSKLFQPPTF